VRDYHTLVIDICLDGDLKANGIEDFLNGFFVPVGYDCYCGPDRTHPNEFEAGLAEHAHVLVDPVTVVLDLGAFRAPELDLPDDIAGFFEVLAFDAGIDPS